MTTHTGQRQQHKIASPQSGTPLSDKKRSRLLALDRRLSTTPPKPPFSPAAAAPSSLKPPKDNADDPSYATLCQAARSGSAATHMQLVSDTRDSGRVIDSILRELVKFNERSVKDIDGVLDTKIQDRVLLLDNPSGQGRAVERARKKARENLAKRSKKHMSMRQHRQHGSLALPFAYHKYTFFLQMHEMWKDYAKRLIQESSKMIEPNLIQADLHGAILAVVQAKITTFTGLQGIVVRETENTFAILTSVDKLHVVPKAGSVFMLQLQNLRITLYGDHLTARRMNIERR